MGWTGSRDAAQQIAVGRAPPSARLPVAARPGGCDGRILAVGGTADGPRRAQCSHRVSSRRRSPRAGRGAARSRSYAVTVRAATARSPRRGRRPHRTSSVRARRGRQFVLAAGRDRGAPDRAEVAARRRAAASSLVAGRAGSRGRGQPASRRGRARPATAASTRHVACRAGRPRTREPDAQRVILAAAVTFPGRSVPTVRRVTGW